MSDENKMDWTRHNHISQDMPLDTANDYVTLRDQMAMAALPAVILAHREQGCIPREIAADLWPIVDAVLAARSAKGDA